MKEEAELFSDYGIFSIKNSRKKIYGKICINSEGLAKTTLMERLVPYRNQSEIGKYEDIAENYHVFINTKDQRKSILLQKSCLEYHNLFKNTQILNTTLCIIFDNKISMYNSLYEKKSVFSLELDVSKYHKWFDLLPMNNGEILSWDTHIGSIKIDRQKNTDIKLFIYFKKPHSTEECAEIYTNIYRFFLTFINHTKEIPHPRLVFKNGEKALLINHKMKNFYINEKDGFSSNIIHPDIFKGELGNCLSTYLLNYKIYNQAYYLYTCRYFQKLYIEHLIASLFWGFEHIINVNYKNIFAKIEKSKYKKEDVEAWVNFLHENEKINSRGKRSLLKKIMQENYLSLGAKIEIAIQDIYPDFDKKTISTFVNSLVQIRNDISHRGGLRPEVEKANYQNMRLFLNCLDFFYRSLLMKVSGIPRENIKLMLQTKYHIHNAHYMSIECLRDLGFKI
nr:HEPN domain-containing protein [uncultured Acetobacter sp.]